MSKWGFVWGDPVNAWWGIEQTTEEINHGTIFGGVNGTGAIVTEREVCIHALLHPSGVELPYVIGGSRTTSLLQGWVQRDEVTLSLLDVDDYYSTGAGHAQIAPTTLFRIVQDTKTPAGNDTRSLGIYRFRSNPDIDEDANGRVITVKANEWARWPMSGGGFNGEVRSPLDLINIYAPSDDLEGISDIDVLGYAFSFLGFGAYPVYKDSLSVFPNTVNVFGPGVTRGAMNRAANAPGVRSPLPPKNEEDVIIAYAKLTHPLVWYDGDGGVHITTADGGAAIDNLSFTCAPSTLAVPGETINRQMSPPQYSSVQIIQPQTWADIYAALHEPMPFDQHNLVGTLPPRLVASAQALNARIPSADTGESKPMDIIDLGQTIIPINPPQYYANWLMHEELAKADQIRISLDSGFPFNTIGQVISFDYPPIVRGYYKLINVDVPYDESAQTWTLEWFRDARNHDGVIAP